MTNGEKIQTILDIDKDCTEVYGKNGMMTFSVPQDWWNAKYEEPTKQKLSWIYVYERLPEIDGDYLVIEKSGRICTYVFHKKGNSEEYWKRCALAWTELPKLYRALEEESVLDKIRAEIEELRYGQPFRKFVVDECLEIIDKYKAESEE